MPHRIISGDAPLRQKAASLVSLTSTYYRDDKVLLLYGSGRDQLAAIERLWRLVAAAQMLVYTYPHPGGRLGIPPIRFLIPADSVGAVVGAGGLGLREINAALAESGASVQVEPQPLLAPTGATTSTYGRSGKALAVAAHGSIDAAVRAIVDKVGRLKRMHKLSMKNLTYSATAPSAARPTDAQSSRPTDAEGSGSRSRTVSLQPSFTVSRVSEDL